MRKPLWFLFFAVLVVLLCGFIVLKTPAEKPLTIVIAAAFLVSLAVGLYLLVNNRKLRSEMKKIVVRYDELEAKNAMLDTIITTIPDMIFVKDLNGTFIECSGGFAKYSDIPRHEIIGKNDETLYDLATDIYKAYLEADREVAYSRTPKVIEEAIYSPHYGTSMMFETIKVPLLQDDKVIGILGIARDITERIAAQNTLKNILDGMDANIYVSDVETDEILFISGQMVTHFGIKGGAVGDICWKVLQKGFTERCSFCPMHRLKENPEAIIFWEEHNTQTGRFYKNTDCLIEWTDGRKVHLQHSVDITNLKQIEEALVEAKEQAERSNHAKSDFLSRMSHEMRTPMNAIIGMTSIGKSAKEIERKDYSLEKIDAASKHLLGVINDILDMSKIEAGKFELSYSEFPFERMLQRVVDVINFRIDEKRQNFTIKIDQNVPWTIVSDEQRLSQVLANLLSNAVKFTGTEGSISLSVELVQEQDDRCVLRIAVTDSGIGISKEQQEKIFRSFEQADGGIARRFGGTGLGLAISKSIIEMMDGEIWIESNEGEGSSFIFTVTVQRGTAEPGALAVVGVNWNDLRVLAVDDAVDVLEYFCSLADLLGFSCDTAESGEEAIGLFESGKTYNVVFVDWKMPGMDGITLARRIKDVSGENVIVVMISAAQWSEIEADATSAGVNRFLPKPLFSSAIVDCISECVGYKYKKTPDGILNTNRYMGKVVLLAEDMEINREIVIALLEETGVTIEIAGDGRQAYTMFKEAPKRYDLILMDIHMPEMDGLEATRQIRQLNIPEARTVPIIAMTANVFREDVERCLQAGMNNHVGKPIDIQEVIEKLDPWLIQQDSSLI